MLGSISLGTSTIAVAGRMSPKNFPWAAPTFSQLAAISTTYMRVRTTCFSAAPAFPSADSMLRSVCIACSYALPMPTISPLGPVAVVPDTQTWLPRRTAREYPTIGSHLLPVEMFCLMMMLGSRLRAPGFRLDVVPQRHGSHRNEQQHEHDLAERLDARLQRFHLAHQGGALRTIRHRRQLSADRIRLSGASADDATADDQRDHTCQRTNAECHARPAGTDYWSEPARET